MSRGRCSPRSRSICSARPTRTSGCSPCVAPLSRDHRPRRRGLVTTSASSRARRRSPRSIRPSSRSRPRRATSCSPWRRGSTSSSAPRSRTRGRHSCRVSELDGDGVSIEYTSPRQLCVLLRGLAEGTARHYGEEARSTRSPACAGATRRAGSRCGSARPAPPEPARVADAERDAVAVEPLEHELGGSARAPEQVAEARERDRPGALALGDDELAGAVVGDPVERQAVADADEAPCALELGGCARSPTP